VAKLLGLGADPWAKNREGMNPAVYGWGFLIEHREDGEKYTNIWVCMLRVLEKQREVAQWSQLAVQPRPRGLGLGLAPS
jgi:hypothetical protein